MEDSRTGCTYCTRWGPFLLWGRQSKLRPEGSRLGVAPLQLEQQLRLRAPLGFSGAPGSKGWLQTPASQLAPQRTCPRPHAWKMIWPLSGSSPLSRARQRPDGLWETLPVSATPSRKPHGSFVLQTRTSHSHSVATCQYNADVLKTKPPFWVSL